MSTINLRERHIDRLLSEELEASSTFIAWFLRQVFGDQVPQDIPSTCSTIIGHNRIAGETDILVKVEWRSGVQAEIHVEDKIDASPQPDQALRYARAVEKSATKLAASALVAPQAWMHRHPRETARYNTVISFEDIANQLGASAADVEDIGSPQSLELARRLRWREGLLNGSTKKRMVYTAIKTGELTDWNAAAAEIISAVNGLVLTVRERQRSEGRNKESRFIRFDEQLSPNQYGRTPILKLKTTGTRVAGRVSLEVPLSRNDNDLRGKATDAGFQISDTDAGTLVISASTPSLQKLIISSPVADQVRALEDAAEVAQKLIEWWESQLDN